MKTPLERVRHDDDGASLIFALIFIAICGIFIAAALQNSSGATLAGSAATDRGKLQYALDAGISRAVNVLQTDAATANPQYCPDPTAGVQQISSTADPGGFSVNGKKVGYKCETLSGGVKNNGNEDKNFAIVLTSSATDALQTQSGSSATMVVKGSVYFAGDETNAALKKVVEVSGGSILEGPTGPGCATGTSGNIGSNIFLDPTQPGHFKGCTPQQLSDAIPSLTLPGTQPTDLRSISLPTGTPAYNSGYTVPNPARPSKNCQVFVPGTYKNPPQLATNGNYFMTGYYFFDNVGAINISNNSVVIGGQRSPSDPTPSPDFSSGPATDTCTGMTDSAAAAGVPAQFAPALTLQSGLGNRSLATGVEWVFGGNTTLTSGAPLVLNKPCTTTDPVCTNGAGPNGEEPVSIYESPASGSVDPNRSGLPSWATSDPWSGSTSFVNTNNANAALSFGGKVYAPDADVSIFTSNPGSAGAAAGVVAKTASLSASVAGNGNLNLVGTALTHPQVPPKRVLRITSFDQSAAPSKATDVAIVTVWNFSYEIDVESWRTGP